MSLGKKTTELFNNESNFEEAFDKVKTDGEWKGELKQTTKDNEEIIVSSRWTLVRDNSGNPESVFVVNTDVTDSKQIQRQLLQAQKLESVGTLAGGIAHDLNNVLQPIMMSLGLLKEHINDEKAENWIHILEESANRGASLVSQVLSFARGSEGEYKYLNINNLVKEIKKVLDETLPKSIEIHSDLDEEPWGISGDLTQLHQVIMNLCVNARDAMPDGGTLTISTENLDIDINYAQINVDAETGPYVVVTVSDTGEGIAKGHIDKIFDPFFTTKEPGEGTGLGLSTSYSIIKNHGGFIHVYSEPRVVTDFKIYLPAIRQNEVVEPEQETVKDIQQGNGELILVVDDEAAVREITKLTLESNGYKVLTASDGADGVAVYTDNKDEVELVIMDMMMPVMNGSASITAIKKISPEVRIIECSGNVSEVGSDIQNHKIYAKLKKPYTTDRLLKTVNQALKK